MQLRRRTMSLAGTLVFGVLTLVPAPVQAGCCGGGGHGGGGYGGGHTFGRASYAGYSSGYGRSCCGMSMGSVGGHGMAGMNMAGGVAPYQPYTTGAAPVPTAPVANAGRYTCPMHPSVVSGVPGSCPYCGMALTRR